MAGKEANVHLIPLLGDPARAVRHAACDALVETGAQGFIPEIRTLLEGESGPAKMFAAYALARLGDSSGRNVLLAAKDMDNLYWRTLGEEGLKEDQ